MTLFAALGEKSTAPTSTCSPPTAVQLHSLHSFDFIGNRITNEAIPTATDAHNVTKKYQHSLLSYQAVQTQQDEEEKSHTKPDLGVWNCSLNNEFDAEALGSVLKSVVLQSGVVVAAAVTTEENKENEETSKVANEISTNTVLLTIQLEELTNIQPTLERMRNVILSAFGEDGLKIAGKGTTSIKTLQSCTFGTSQIKQEVNPQSVPGAKIALILAAIVPASKEQGNASTEYQERQKQSLVVYHLHKFALEVNCTLCFVRDGDTAKRGETISTMTIEELASVVRRVAMGSPPVDNALLTESADNGSNENQESTTDTAPAAEPSIYSPGSHDAELICGAMQRNASCEGLWDASKDDLVKALPPVSKKSSDDAETTETKGEDEVWLEKLASSVGITVDTTKDAASSAPDDTKTPVEKKRETMKKKKSTKAPTTSKSEKAPSDFFANLLKK
ncbi:hypothetical protein ACHAWO_006363 [Cyclotella atomus]|uniref:DNA polymerase delta subunit 3 n=1 Tax=Cyclotella atomus TaxID=382360 RepID=A0ABD3P7A1_9STRA